MLKQQEMQQFMQLQQQQPAPQSLPIPQQQQYSQQYQPHQPLPQNNSNMGSYQQLQQHQQMQSQNQMGQNFMNLQQSKASPLPLNALKNQRQSLPTQTPPQGINYHKPAAKNSLPQPQGTSKIILPLRWCYNCNSFLFFKYNMPL
jgi:hypothetical protein